MDKAEIFNMLNDKMEKSLQSLDHELAGLRTGRANTKLLDSIPVEAYGSKMPMSQVGTVSAPEAKLLTIQIWDKQLVKAAEKAIVNANLGVNPVTDGQLIRVALPDLSEERRKELAKLAAKYGENAKISLRNIRREAIESAKKLQKDGIVSEDELHNITNDIQVKSDDYTKKIDQKIATKESEILSVK